MFEFHKTPCFLPKGPSNRGTTKSQKENQPVERRRGRRQINPSTEQSAPHPWSSRCTSRGACVHFPTCVARTLRGRDDDPAKCFLDGAWCARAHTWGWSISTLPAGAGSPLTPAIRLRLRSGPLTFSSLPVPRALLNGCHPHLFLLLRNRFYILLRGHDPAPPSSPPPHPSPRYHPSSAVLSGPGPVSSWRASCFIRPSQSPRGTPPDSLTQVLLLPSKMGLVL